MGILSLRLHTSQPSTPLSAQSSQAKTKEVEELRLNDCKLFDIQIHPLMVPFLTPMKSNAIGLAAYIVPVNHYRINRGLFTSIASNMMDLYSEDNTEAVIS